MRTDEIIFFDRSHAPGDATEVGEHLQKHVVAGEFVVPHQHSTVV